MSRLTRQINGEWDFSSLEGERTSGVVCHRCGEIVPLVYFGVVFIRFRLVNVGFCPICFTGDIETALTGRIGF